MLEASKGDVTPEQTVPSPLDYFKSAISDEIRYVSEQKKAGHGIVGFYCEFTPRDLILAAGATPICLCGTSQNTITHAETVLPSNLCPLIKSSYGYALTGGCPLLNDSDLLVAETTCDGKKKMYEVLSRDKNMHVLELTQKSDKERAFRHWLAEVEELKQKLEQTFQTDITEEKLRTAIKAMNEERRLILAIQELGQHRPAIVSGYEIAQTRYRVAGFSKHLEQMKHFLAMADQRLEQGYQAAPASAPRVLLTGCPTGHGTEKLIEIIEECGGVVVVQEACSGIKGVYEEVSEQGDPLEAIARKHFNIPCSCMTPNEGRKELLRKLAKDYQADAVIDLVWQACHTYNVESVLLHEFVRKELGLAYLKVETDYSSSDREQLKVRVQTLLELAQ
ncbi:double-cubane-cluster-containing anaerobic reductase [Photobacterium sp. OFAV2-7]|uniref:double-cubane-cluster-containing anaerobic reductase n=1 Tax=Photobacterium sp. OFAV2-7 TaxID=2917748 RepID=UPI001EF47583|nr:double-cubane-cluster-containing anaerobic reductase [Photobacterium sp. OFAV2-7]MCG7586253.1 2-hydroxyacyl-CoA dehydratase family protein [Photobacterium sp. OFAV2-7]